MSNDFFNDPDATYRIVSEEELQNRAAEKTVKQAAARAERERKRANGPSRILASLEVDQSHLFEQYVVSSQISATVGRTAAILGRTFRTERVIGKGVRVTRVL